MCEPDDPIFTKADRILRVEEWDLEDEWYDDPGGNFESKSNEPGEEQLNGGITKPGLSKDRKGYFQFLSRKKGLRDWIFHQYDADFHPSVPHGHFQGKKQPKLDCYLGWVYNGSQQIKRLNRDLIIELWNDDEFRIFAYTSIEWYMAEFPKFNWRVSNPLSLPRHR